MSRHGSPMAWDLLCVPLLRMKTLLPWGGNQLSEVQRRGTQRLLPDEEECGNSNKGNGVHFRALSQGWVQHWAGGLEGRQAGSQLRVGPLGCLS